MDVTNLDYDFSLEVVSVLLNCWLPIKLTVNIVRIVSMSFLFFLEEINEQIKKPQTN